MSKDMIEKLQHISALEKERAELEQYVKNGCDEETDNAVREVKFKLKKQSPATKKMQDAYVELPKKLEEIPTFNGFFKLLGIGYVIAALFGLIFIPEGKVLYFGLVTILAGVLTFKQWKKVQNKDQIIEQRNQQYEKDLDAYRQVIAEYKSHLEEMEQQLPKYEAAYRQAFPKCLQIYSDGEKQKAAAKEKLDACTNELNEKNFVGNAYLYLVDDIIHLLQSGRADEYKEALNIAVAEDRQKKLEEKRAEEERRQAEAARKQAEEDRIRAIVDAKMQADRERAAAEKAARDQAAAAKYAADKAERERQAAGFRKCINCANNSKCSIYVQESGAGLTCGNYRPR